ncbi:retrotransposon protein, putative, ty1-copia subclass [Tanacetum coccineum]
MLSASKLPLFFWAEAIATACYTQNRSIIIPTHEKTAYHIINDRKPSIKHLHIFGCTCYLTRDGENLDKMKEKGDPCILVGYSTQSKGYRVYNKRTRLIVESIHLRFDEIKEMFKTSVSNDTSRLVPQRQKASYYDNPDPELELQNSSPSADTTVPSQQELDILFGPFYDEFFNDGTSRFNKSSSPTDNSTQQDTLPTTNIHPTSEPTTQTNVHAEENNDNQTEFTNPFCIPTTWLGNSLTNLLERTVIKLRGLWKNKMDEDQTVIRNNARLVDLRLCSGKTGGGFYVAQLTDSLYPDHPEQSLRSKEKALYGLKQVESLAKYTLEILKKHGMEKGQSIGTPMATKPKLDADLSGETHIKQESTENNSSKEVKRDLSIRMSTSGGIQFLGDKLVSWMSKKQDCTAMSSAEAEYVALSASCAQVMWMRTQLQDYGFNYNKIPLYCDSQSAIAISCNPVQHSQLIPIGDMFTKALPEERFQYLVRRIGMRCLTPAELEVLTKESA